MRLPRQLRVLGCLLALMFLVLWPCSAAAQTASWLDVPPPAWNLIGKGQPPHAPVRASADPRCQNREKVPAYAEETQLSVAGWKLESYWPAQITVDITIVIALSDYDGMCRPAGFNVFVFSGGRFAGTLSPSPMDSRTDGVLASSGTGPAVKVLPDGTLEAEFQRYSPADPRCCPSRGHTRVVYHIDRTDGQVVVVPQQIGDRTFTVPAMPNTGGGGTAKVCTGADLTQPGCPVTCQSPHYRTRQVSQEKSAVGTEQAQGSPKSASTRRSCSRDETALLSTGTDVGSSRPRHTPRASCGYTNVRGS